MQFRFDDTFDASKAVLARVDYLRKQGKLSDEDADRVTIIEGLGAISVVLCAVAQDVGRCVLPSIQAGEAAARRSDAAYAIAEAINTVADAQLQPLLNAAPKFQVPKRSTGGGGGAASLSMGSWVDPVEQAATDAAPKIIASLPLVEFALDAGTSFPADEPAGKFFAHLLANRPADADAVRDAVEDAFRATEK